MPESKAFNMDCMDALKAVPDNYFALCCADPPYGINVTGRHRSQSVKAEREREREPHTARWRWRQTIRR